MHVCGRNATLVVHMDCHVGMARCRDDVEAVVEDWEVQAEIYLEFEKVKAQNI